MQIWVEIAPQHAHTVMMRLKQSFICMWNVKSQRNSGIQPENGILAILGFLLLLSYRSGPLLFGLEKEKPQDLFNIFYRSVRYCIFKNRKKTFKPSLRYFITLVKDELRHKYNKNKILRYKTQEAKAVAWLSAQMGWTGTDLNWPRKSYKFPTLNFST